MGAARNIPCRLFLSVTNDEFGIGSKMEENGQDDTDYKNKECSCQIIGRIGFRVLLFH